MLVNVIAVIDAMKSHVGKTPLTRIEVIALVNESDMVIAVIDAPYKSRLASVAIASPLVKDKDSRKIPDVEYSGRKGLRDIIKDVMGERVGHIAKGELLP